MKVYAIWEYDEKLEPPLVKKLTTTLNEGIAEERGLWDYAQLHQGTAFAVVREELPQTDPPTRVILSVFVVRDGKAQTESRA